MVAASQRAWDRIGQTRSPRFYFDLKRARAAAEHGQMPWTPPISIIYALDVALQRYHAEGMAKAHARHARFAAAVRAALERLGFTLVSRPDAHSPTVVAAYPPAGVDIALVLRRLREEHRVVLSGGQAELAGKILRFGTMGDVHDVDFLGAIGALELILLDLGVTTSPGSATSAALEALSQRVTSGVA